MLQFPLVTCILLHYTKITVNFWLPAERPHCMVILLVGHIWLVLKSKTISFWRYNDLHCFVWGNQWTSKGKIASFTCNSVYLDHGMDKCMDNSCKWRAEYLCHSLVIVCTERGQWQASFTWEKLVSLVEVGVTEQILWKFPNSQTCWGNWACTVCTRLSLYLYPRMRAWEWGYIHLWKKALFFSVKVDTSDLLPTPTHRLLIKHPNSLDH